MTKFSFLLACPRGLSKWLMTLRVGASILPPKGMIVEIVPGWKTVVEDVELRPASLAPVSVYLAPIKAADADQLTQIRLCAEAGGWLALEIKKPRDRRNRATS